MICSSQEINDRFFIQDIASDSETDKDKRNQFLKKVYNVDDNESSTHKKFWYKEVSPKENSFNCSVLIPKMKGFFDLIEIEKYYTDIQQTQNKLNSPKEEIVPEVNIFGEKSLFSFVEIITNKVKKEDENNYHPILLNSTNDSQNVYNFQEDVLLDSPLNKPCNTLNYLTNQDKIMRTNFLNDITRETSLILDNKNNFIKGCFEVSSYNFAISAAYEKCSVCRLKSSQSKFKYCTD